MRVKFIVKGRRPFPIDMLRYDNCYPANIPAVESITESLDPQIIDNDPGMTRKVSLKGRVAPTMGRWNSFGWEVTDIQNL